MRPLLALACALAACSSSGTDAPVDAGADTAATVESGAPCTFNQDCPDAQRCDCATDACRCAVGPRGKGKAGVDTCTSALDCETGLCVEGTTGFVCSGPCAAGCGAKLPRCVDVASLGPICARAVTSSGATGSFAGRTWAFDHAYFGWDLGDAGPVATSLELHAGSDGSCPPPKKDPQATVVVSGLPGALAAGSHPGLKATLLGLDPALPIKSSATSVTLSAAALEPCAAPDAARACAFDATVALSFAEGTIEGTVHAIHCPSMDLK